MFYGWTSREKMLLGINLILLLVVGGFFLHHFRGDSSYVQETLQPYPDLVQGTNVRAQDDHGDQDLVGQETEYSLHSSPGMEEKVTVDIKGAVQAPGVYTLSSTDRVIDALERAGGLLEEASTLSVNLAQPLQDGMVIYIPTQDELQEGVLSIPTNGPAGGIVSNSGKININKATAEELQALPGIGPTRAAAIVRYREEHGPFKSLDEITNVSGIGPKILENIADQIEL